MKNILWLMFVGLIVFAAGCNGKQKQAECLRNLNKIDNVKALWREVEEKELGDTPTLAELEEYFPEGVPLCPGKGKYTIGPAGKDAECSVHGPSGFTENTPGGW